MTIVSEMLARHAAGQMRKPCDDAVKWLGAEDDWRRAWDRCPRGEWQLWAAREYGHRPALAWVAREVVSFAFGYAAEALDRAGLDAHAEALRGHRGALREATDATAAGLLAAAMAAAWAARDAAWDARDAWAARDARDAAWAAWAAARTAAWDAAGAAAEAARDAAGTARTAARDAEHRRCADAVRTLWPAPPWLAEVEVEP
jgi:hypothetical protein